ncbi:hypothetical protein [Bowmanella denitrificans]|uniref:hypothetical protein n=1 Tax=Bowmanella denitrificans TaxID=366582 RepID=UPI000C99E3C7|nr:hypothetical protein [Bowmanella denitrificans]
MIWFELVLLGLSLLLRIALTRKAKLGFDTFGHLYFCDLFQNQKSGPFDGIATGIAHSHKLESALYFNWLMAKIPHYSEKKNRRYFNCAMDAIFGLSLIPMCTASGLPLESALAVSLVYLSCPMWFSGMAIGPRITNFTPRLMSELLVNLYFIFVFYHQSTGNLGVLIVAVFMGIVVLLSSKFGTQALLFLTILLVLLCWSVQPALPLFLTIAASLIVTKGRYAAMLSAHLKHLHWYLKENIANRMFISTRNDVRQLALPFNRYDSVWNNIKAVSIPYAAKNSYTAVLFKLPLLVLLSAIWLASLIVDRVLTVPDYSPLVLAAVFLFLLTSQKVFLFLGEAERYLNHIAVFVVLLFVDVVYQIDLPWLILAVAGYGLLFGLMELIIENEQAHKLTTKVHEKQRVMSWLMAQPKQTVLLSPYHCMDGVWRVLRETSHQVLYPITMKKDKKELFESKFSDRYPFCKLDDPEGLFKEFGVGVIVCESGTSQEVAQSSAWQREAVGGRFYDVFTRKKSNARPGSDS